MSFFSQHPDTNFDLTEQKLHECFTSLLDPELLTEPLEELFEQKKK